MRTIKVPTWDALEEKLQEFQSTVPGGFLGYLYRGHHDASWLLQTTLERTTNKNFISDYYRVIGQIKAQLESLQEQIWGDLDWKKLTELTTNYEPFTLDLSLGKLPNVNYLIYLRHHGFPSPLLDWSGSLYVAAFFAFARRGDSDRAIYVYSESPQHMKGRSSAQPEIYSIGPNIRTHRRHVLQQSSYTLCVKFAGNGDRREWEFASHEDVFRRNETEQDVLLKFVVPHSERINILKKLDQHNLNAYSLFGSEESLLDMISIRKFDFN